MARLLPGVFQIYEFESEDELINAMVFRPEQLLNINNMLANFMAEKASLDGEGRTPEEFVKANEYLRGKIDGLRLLLAQHVTLADKLAANGHPL